MFLYSKEFDFCFILGLRLKGMHCHPLSLYKPVYDFFFFISVFHDFGIGNCIHIYESQYENFALLDILRWTLDNCMFGSSTVDIGFRSGGSSVVPVLQWYWSYYRISSSSGNGGYRAVTASRDGDQ